MNIFQKMYKSIDDFFKKESSKGGCCCSVDKTKSDSKNKDTDTKKCCKG